MSNLVSKFVVKYVGDVPFSIIEIPANRNVLEVYHRPEIVLQERYVLVDQRDFQSVEQIFATMQTHYNFYNRPTLEQLEEMTTDELTQLLINEVEFKRPDINYLRQLVEWGANVNAFVVEQSMCLLAHSMRFSNSDVFNFLITYNADISVLTPNGDSLLHLAAAWERQDYYSRLIELGLDPLIQNRNGDTAQMIADYYFE